MSRGAFITFDGSEGCGKLTQVQRLVSRLDAAARPGRTSILDLDAVTARARMLRRVRPVQSVDRMEQEPLEIYEHVSEGYRELARREPERIRLLDGSGSPDEVEDKLWREVSGRFPAMLALRKKAGAGRAS